MPRPKADGDLTHHHVLLYRGDFERLQDYFPEVTASVVIRKLIRKTLTDLDKKSRSKVDVETEVSL